MTVKNKTATAKNILCFGEVVRAGSITEAARQNGFKQSNLSTLLKEFEKKLECKLFAKKNNNELVLTEDGKQILDHYTELNRVLNKVESYSLVSRNPKEIRLWIGDGLASDALSTNLAFFYQKYPDVSININCSIENPICISENDIAIVYSEPQNMSAAIINKQIMNFGLFASKDYLLRYGTPKSIEELCNEHYICNRANFTSLWEKWKDIIKNTQKLSLQTNSASVLLSAIKEGVGIGLLPKIGCSSNLIELSNLNINLSLPFWIISHLDTKDNPKIRALINYIIELTKNL